MHGDSGRRFDADALDRAWDDLVRGGGGDPSELTAIVHDLGAGIPASAGGARDRVWQRLAISTAPTRRAVRTKLSIALVPQPGQARISVPRRWFSSPMLAAEGIIACLLIVSFAIGISAFRGEGHRGASDRVLGLASPQPQTTMDPWHLLNLHDQAVPAATTWTGEVSGGTVYLALSEIVFPVGTGFAQNSVTQPSIYLLAVMQGTVTVTIDDQAPQTLTAGEAASYLITTSLAVRNSGVSEAHIIQGAGWPGYVPAPPATPVTATPSPGYYGYFLGNAVVELPADRISLTLEIATAATASRSTVETGYTLIQPLSGPIELRVAAGTVGVRNEQTSRDDYLQGTGFHPIPIGSSAIVDYNTMLAEPGASYTLSTTRDDQILMILLSVSPAD